MFHLYMCWNVVFTWDTNTLWRMWTWHVAKFERKTIILCLNREPSSVMLRVVVVWPHNYANLTNAKVYFFAPNPTFWSTWWTFELSSTVSMSCSRCKNEIGVCTLLGWKYEIIDFKIRCKMLVLSKHIYNWKDFVGFVEFKSNKWFLMWEFESWCGFLAHIFGCGFERIVDYDNVGAFVYMHIGLPSGVVTSLEA